MKKITLMILVSLMSFFAHAQLPVEHFDDPWTGTPAAPPQWTVINQYGPNITWIQTIPGNTQQPPFGGTGHSAYLAKENVAPTDAIPSDWLVTKSFPMVANAELRFQSRLTIAGDQGSIYKIYIMPAQTSGPTPTPIAPTYANFTNPTIGTLLTTYTELTLNPVQTDWTEKVFNIPANANYAPTTPVYVAFVMEGDDKDRWSIDDVMVSAICVPPTNPLVSATTTTSASLNWTTGGTSWEVEVVADSATPTGVGTVYTGALPYVKTGLTACTNYKYYVRTKCSDGGSSAWVGPIFFKTKCVGETCAEPLIIPPGNQSVSGNTANFGDFYEGISGTGCNSTGNYLAGNDVVYSYTANATGNYNVSLTGTGGPAGVFIYSSCANIGVSCLNGGVASATVPVNIAAFPMTAGTTYYFVVSTNGTPQTTQYTLSIQQVFCPQPTAGTATLITGTTATLGWTPGTVGATSWQMAVQAVGSGLPATGATVTSNTGNTVGGTTAGVPFTPATTYEFYVRESCAGGQFSIWAGPFQFTTLQVAATLNYAQNFDAGAHGFTLANGTQVNKWVVGSATSNSPANSLYITDNGTANSFNINSLSVVQAYRDIQMPAAIGQLALSFDWKGLGESCCDYLRVWMVPATFTPQPGTQITAAASGGMQIGGNLNMQSAWQNSLTIFSAPTAWNNQTMRLVFEWRNDGSIGTQPPAAVDNINLSLVTCPQPTALAVTSLNPTTGVVSWTAPAIVPAQGYDVYVSNTPTPSPSAATVPTQTVTGTSANITLTPDTFYYVWVRAHCSATDQSFWTGPVMFSTPQVPATMDYTQNFDTGPHNFTLSNGTQTNKWVVGGATFNSAANSLYISNDNGVTNNYDITLQSIVHAYRDIALPATIPSGQVLLQFDWKGVAEAGDYVRVWNVPIMFTPTPGTQITAANSGGTQIGGNFTGSATWATSNNVINVPAAQLGTTRRIIFEWFNNAFTGVQPPAAIDNINFKVITCPAPTALVLGTLTTNTATVNWTPPTAAPASYDYYYSTAVTPPTATTTPSGNVPGPTATITGLTDSTNYNVWVRSNCGGTTGTSFWVGPLNFNTPQIPAAMPYAENFDGAPHNYTLNNGTQVNKWVVGGATFNSPTKSLYVSNDNGTTNNYDINALSVVQAYRDIQMPASIPSNQVLLQFDWKALGESCCDYLRVYIVPVTFTPTAGTQMAVPAGGVQILGNLNNNNTWTTVNTVVNTTAWPAGSIRRVIFEWRNDGSIGPTPGAAIDNINMSVITCPAPTALVLGTLTTNTATVNWTPPTAVPASYDYYYSTTATAPTAATTPSGNVPGPTATITGLTDSTNYNVWVRSNCGGTAGTSFWVGPLNFNTPQIPAAMPYSQNFDGAAHNYTLNNGTQVNKWVVGGATFNSPANSLYISNDNGATYNYDINALTVVQAYRDIQMPASIPSNQVLFQFDWKALGESCCDYLRVYIVPVTFTPTVGTQMAVPAGGVQILGNLNNNGTWTTVNSVVNTTAWPAGSIRRVIFEWRNDGSIGPTPGAAIDNINMSVITCSAPSALALTSIDAANATFTWTASTPPAASYDYYLTTSPVAPVAGTVPTGNVTGTTLTLSGLPDSANYYLWIRSNCGAVDGSSFWVGGINFNTPQIPATLPYAQNLDGAGNPGFSYTSGTQPNKWVVGGATFNSPANSLYISNDNGVTNNYTSTATSIVHAYRDVVIPAGATTLDFAFDWKNVGEAGDYVRVWRVPLSFTPVAGTAITALAGQRELVTTANLFNGTNWQNTSYAPTVPPGTTQRFVFEWVNNAFTGTSPAAIDNINIKVMTCPKPTALTASLIGMTSASLGWTEVGSATAWEVYVVPVAGVAPGDATVGTPAPTNPFVYTGLTPGTQYKYYVRAICGPGDISRWSGPYNFNTNVCEVVDQCAMNFILTDSGNNGWGTTTMTVTQGGIFVGTLGPQLTTGNGPVTVTFPLCKGLPYEVFFNSGGTNPAQCGLQIVNPFNNQTVFQRVAGAVNSDQNTVIYTGIAYCADITCPQPTNLVSESVVNAPNTTQFSWTPGGTETQWEIIIQPQGGNFPPSAPTTSIIVDEPEYVLANITPGIPYEYYVRAICGPDDKSFWSGALRFSIFTPPACADVTVVDEDLEVIAPDTEYVICPGEELCVDFSASFYTAAAQTTSYEVTNIPFLPPFPTLGGTPLPVDVDDIWSPKVNLPFEFCFMGGVYNAAQVGSNGIVSFNADQPAGGGSGWAFSQTIPNPTFPQRNAIYGVYQDTNPNPTNNSWDNPNINYQVMGNYPCRALVVSFNELAQFNCSTDSAADQLVGAQSSQIVIYEITNIIEVYVKRRVPCMSWQGGVGLIGVQNAAGTVGFAPPGRNTGAWTTNLEAWRFTPNGDTSVVFEWLKDDVFFSNDEQVEVCATAGTTVMTARATYSLCNGTDIVRESDFTIRVEEQIIPAADPVDLTKCGNGEDVTFDLTVAVADVFTDATGYNFTYYPTEQDAIDETNVIAAPTAFVTNATTTVWVRIMKDGLPCFITRSFDVIIANVAPVFGITPDVSICDGTSTVIAVVPDPTEDLTGATYAWTLDGNPLPDTTDSITATLGGSYVVTINKGGCVGTATSVVTLVPMPVADAPADVTACDTYELPALSANNNYYTGPGGTGTLLSATDDITSTQTIYVYAVSPTLAACTDESSFVVTINTTPVIDSPIADQNVCDSYVLPVLAANENYYTGPGATGTALSANDVISATQTIYVYEETGTTPNCSNEASFVVTITPTPVADAPGDVTTCDSYLLPALSADNSYYTAPGGPNGTGTALSAGDPINSTQLIYVYAIAPANPACFAENVFTVNITSTPQFSLGGPYVACVASSLTVSVSGANFNLGNASYVWTVNGVPAGDNSSSIDGTEFGTYEVTVTVGTCSHSESVQVSQDTRLIELAFTDVCEENVYTLEVSDVDGSFNPDTASYSWAGPEGFTSSDRKIVPVGLGEYMVTVTTADGCVSIDTFEVVSTACEIPRGISPNNDGFNDEFDLTSLGVRKISIFNRYGQEVYSKSNYTKEWHGQGKGGDELPTGTYFYMVERSTGESITGWVYINRQD
jgi:gliding motility-associated-like protein